MMRNKLYLLLAILSIFVICLASADKTVQETDSTKDVKQTKTDEVKKDDVDKEKSDRYDYDDEIDDSYSPRSSFAHHRFVSYDPSEASPRTRSRWPSATASGLSHALPTLPFTIEDFPDEDDDEWSTSGYGSAFSPSSLPNNPYQTRGMSQNGPTCSSLIDPQYPVFSDTCGAVPQARYTLPNAFGHRDKWQIAQLLNVLASSTSDTTCTRSIRLLFCPILFPSCPSRQQPSPVLPCQSYCRAVKSRCSMPLLESLPCEILPHSSDLCPTNQGYGSHAPPRAFPHNMQSQSPMNGGHPSQRQQPSLHSLLSSPALQAALSAQNFPGGLNPQTLQAALAAQAFPSLFQTQNLPGAATAPASMPTLAPAPIATPPPVPAAQPMSLYSNIQFPVDTISAMLGEIPTRSYGNEYRQGSRYAPATRSSSETRSTNDLRASSNARSSGGSTMVKA